MMTESGVAGSISDNRATSSGANTNGASNGAFSPEAWSVAHDRSAEPIFEIGEANDHHAHSHQDTHPQQENGSHQHGEELIFDNDEQQQQQQPKQVGSDVPSEYQIFRTPVDLDFAEGSIVAPCDLPEGHVLRIDLGRGRILVTQIPYGGVKEGETFYSPYRIYDKPDDQAREYKPSPSSPRSRGTGAWRVSLCGCCEFGPCHPSFLGALMCQCFLLSQVLTRMHLNWIGLKSPPSVARRTLEGVFLVFSIFYFFRGITLYFWLTSEDDYDAPTMSDNLYFLTLLVDFLFLIFIIVVSTRGRTAVRENYEIPGDMITDCIVGTICHPCALSQMARQSANYREHNYRWCSDTGLGEEYDREYGLTGVVHSMTIDRDLI